MSLLSSYKGHQLQRVSNTELRTPVADGYYRYAVSGQSLPANQRSCWSAHLKAMGSIHIGVIADTNLQHEGGEYNFRQPSYCGVGVYNDYADIYTNGSHEASSELASSAGDVLVFGLDALRGQLRVINSRTRQSVDIVVQHAQQPLFITVNMLARTSSGHVELRHVNAAEMTLLQ